ncbi:hypothetical protein S40285_00475 [Stachybotrys chlorohalonatus IBT 40285]|uniref:Uncharacterized protein n=1 Tax=Stachybotrys chlorohalonatus (strain IBT 40285) TaxID=1283841 RepID=A0A084QNA1_STAC4|nr:hypothetical protein S40285_00475 [Stachybotrys chlorohalonata IBT 40285]
MPPNMVEHRVEKWNMLSLDFWAYSPMYVRSVLPPPVPNDLPAHVNPSVFTWEDAFEDLLAASQGQPLHPIEDLYRKRLSLMAKFPFGEPPYSFRHRLLRGRLAYLPAVASFGIADDGTLQPTSSLVDGKTAFDYLEHEVSKLESYMDEMMEGFRREAAGTQLSEQRQPDHEEDLFSAIASVFSVPKNLLQDPEQDTRPSNFLSPAMAARVDNTRTKVEKEEGVDHLGNKWQTTTTTYYTEDGKELANTVFQKHVGHQDLKASTTNEKETGKKDGWFWK